MEIHVLSSPYPPSRYLREVGFPDSVLEARLSRIAAYKSLYAQNQNTAPEDSIRLESPKVTVSGVVCVCVCLCACVWVA